MPGDCDAAEAERPNHRSIDAARPYEVELTGSAVAVDEPIQRLEAFGERDGDRMAPNTAGVYANEPAIDAFDHDGTLVNDVTYPPARGISSVRSPSPEAVAAIVRIKPTAPAALERGPSVAN